MNSRWSGTFVASMILLGVVSYAANSGLEFGEVVSSSFSWGAHSVSIPVVNGTDYPKFLSVETEVKFDSGDLRPNRTIRSNFIVNPDASDTLDSPVYFPGNFGTADLYLRVFDVVDTLDDLLPYQLVLEHSMQITFAPPETEAYPEVKEYLGVGMTLPPRVEEHPYFDNDFARLLILMIHRERTVQQIADLIGAEPSTVQQAIDRFVSDGYVRSWKDGYELTFPYIGADEAKLETDLAAEVAGELAVLIEANMPRYGKALASLTEAGMLPADTNEFFSGTTVLYRKYPVIGALVLWFDLGKQFITRSAPLAIYDGTDVCNAHIPFYMYAVEGSDKAQHGTNFFNMSRTPSSMQIYFGDKAPQLICDKDFIQKGRTNQRVVWNYDPEFTPEAFIIDTTITRSALNALTSGTAPLLESAYEKLKTIATSHEHQKVSFGHKYWFWNIVATRALDELVEKNVLTRRGNGQFKFDQLAF
ncbi:MAG: hypothetical protein ACE5FH_02980 [Candidatus Zixiibacteriota bacterium]